MGREIRRVPPNWEHPKKQRFDARKMAYVEDYQPMYDRAFAPEMREWYAEWGKWESREHEDYEAGTTFWEWHGSPPDPEFHRPDWAEGTATWFQVYETVSEGTPVTPPFATKAELIDYLAANGDRWDQLRVQEGRKEGPAAWGREAAERFVGSEWAPSMIVTGGKVYEPRDGSPPAHAGEPNG